MYRFFFGAMGAVMLVLLALLIWFYHGFFRRAHMAFCHPEFFPRENCAIAVIHRDRGWKKALHWALTVCAAALTCNVMHMSGLFLLHMAAIGFAMHLLFLLFRSRVSAPVRRIHFSGVVPVMLAALVMALGFANLHHVTATPYTVYTDKPIREGGLRAVLLTDVHYGVSLDDKGMQAVCDEIASLAPDMVLLCGDMVDNDTPAESVPRLFAMLGNIPSTHGVFFAYGNHDRPYTLIRSEFGGDALLSAIDAAGITVLQDERVALGEDVLLAGREDASRGNRLSASALLENADTGRFILMMDHQPADYEGVGPTDTDLLLSGHTHGGQIFPLGQVMTLLGINDLVYGFTTLDHNTAAIVSSGLAGWRFPIKTNAPAEYVVIDILPR